MNIQRLGDDLGGWTVDLDSIPVGSTIIDAGTGFNITFTQKIYELRKVKCVLIDPIKASEDWAMQESQLIPGSEFICAAVSKETETKTIFRHRRHSDSLRRDNRNVNRRLERSVQCVGLKGLIAKYQPSFMKLDLEGEEFNVYKECLGVKQVAFEFHHRLLRLSSEAQTMEAVQWFTANGYVVVHWSNHDQITFLRLAD